MNQDLNRFYDDFPPENPWEDLRIKPIDRVMLYVQSAVKAYRRAKSCRTNPQFVDDWFNLVCGINVVEVIIPGAYGEAAKMYAWFTGKHDIEGSASEYMCVVCEQFCELTAA